MKEKLFKLLFPSKNKELETTKKALASANSDIRELVLNPDSRESMTIKMLTKFNHDLETAFLFGSHDEEMR